MKLILRLNLFLALLLSVSANAQMKVMNPGEAKGQLVYLSVDDVLTNTAKFQSLNPLSIPVFAELPMDLSVVAGSITLKQQNLLSHVQLKSRARHTPNLDISQLEGGLASNLMMPFKDGDWVHLLLGIDGSVVLEKSSEQEAIAFQKTRVGEPVKLVSDVQNASLLSTGDLTWKDFYLVGSKAANYAELSKTLNTPERTVVRPGFAIPFYYYQQFIESNPEIKLAIEQVLNDPLMKRLSKSSYREHKLNAIVNLIMSPASIISQQMLDALIDKMETFRTVDGLPRSMKLRSSTNSEDLPNFNGAGLYSSEAYKPTKKGVEKTRLEKEESLKFALRTVWASIWTLRAYDEREHFQIPHADVKMGIQVNPSFGTEYVDGVVVTKNILNDPSLSGPGVYIEAQRGDKNSVANPNSGVKPEKILVLIDRSQIENKESYQIHIIQKSNIADDNISVLTTDNPNPVMSDAEIKDLVFLVLKAEAHFKPILGENNSDFALDLEFKVAEEDRSERQVYLKQARPYID